MGINFLTMDVEQLPTCLDLFSYSGATLNLEKCSLLMNSLVVLQNENHFKKIYFWGQIFGIMDDYYIAFGYQKDVLRGRTFYYSRNAIDWYLLPILRPKDRIHYLTHIATNRFFGNPALQIEVLDDQPQVKMETPDEEGFKEEMGEEENGLEGYIDPEEHYSVTEQLDAKDFVLKEEERLSSTVRFINQEAAVVPRGALFKQTTGYVVPNPAFGGLRLEDATLLSNYLHYRVPRERWEVNVARRPDYNYATDFLDSIDQDLPQNFSWSINVVRGNRGVILQSLYWPGFSFYHQLESKLHGYLYIGLGKKNLDIPFMI